jgi:hypothetical protein
MMAVAATALMSVVQMIIQLNGTNTTGVPDTYRQAQIEFINKNALVWHQRSLEDN